MKRAAGMEAERTHASFPCRAVPRRTDEAGREQAQPGCEPSTGKRCGGSLVTATLSFSPMKAPCGLVKRRSPADRPTAELHLLLPETTGVLRPPRTHRFREFFILSATRADQATPCVREPWCCTASLTAAAAKRVTPCRSRGEVRRTSRPGCPPRGAITNVDVFVGSLTVDAVS